jgi:sulfoxide reductase heme-binding subunit YedZ
MFRRGRIWLKVAAWVVCLAPLALLLFRAATGGLGANPISYVTNWLGDWTLRILLASLAMTPLRIVFGLSWPLSLRRLLGLFAFTYAAMHFSIWLVLDHFFDWREMGADIVKRPYITMGMMALTLMLPLAATSTVAAIRRLGAKNWERLHRLAYAIGVCAVLHYLWLAKKANPDPYYYAWGLAVLLAVRAWNWGRRRLARARVVSVRATGGSVVGGLSVRTTTQDEGR